MAAAFSDHAEEGHGGLPNSQNFRQFGLSLRDVLGEQIGPSGAISIWNPLRFGSQKTAAVDGKISAVRELHSTKRPWLIREQFYRVTRILFIVRYAKVKQKLSARNEAV